MEKVTQKHQLAAIMFTDIVGYTALMGEDSNKAMDYHKKNTSCVTLLKGS